MKLQILKKLHALFINIFYNNQFQKEEEKHLKTQVADVFKILGIGVPFMIIPGATLLIPFILKAAKKKV